MRWLLIFALGCQTEEAPPDPPDVTDTGLAVTGSNTAPTIAPIALCINEVMAVNSGALERDGTWPDWIELHNPTADAIDLDQWILTDDGDNAGRIEGSLPVPAGGFLLLYADVDGEGIDDLPFQLDSDGDAIRMVRPDGAELILHIPASAADYAFARETDCCVGDCWTSQIWGTPGASNDGGVDTGP